MLQHESEVRMKFKAGCNKPCNFNTY